MTGIKLSVASFPSLATRIYAKWAPILLQPISGSYERLVVGCAVVAGTDYHLESANALHRLQCLYADRADHVAYIIEMSNDAIRQDIAKRGVMALEEAANPFSGIHIGDIREGEGASLEEIAKGWMSVLSSLYERKAVHHAVEGDIYAERSALSSEVRSSDRLPQLVLEQVSGMNLSLARHFSQRIVEGRSRRRAAHELDIDFKGRRLVANFATLNAGRIAPAVGNIKQRLWDLKIDRENDRSSGRRRDHELIIQLPRLDDPQVSERQHQRLEDEYRGLLEQADLLQLALRHFNTAQQIGEHIVAKEAA
ncbi:hypothetical protein [Cereibacter sphaeroides]|uniref:hypothetical protein n=1 Tax=Cereibacter sphaeroides TaxID=1063 RepID=UPI00313B5A25